MPNCLSHRHSSTLVELASGKALSESSERTLAARVCDAATERALESARERESGEAEREGDAYMPVKLCKNTLAREIMIGKPKHFIGQGRRAGRPQKRVAHLEDEAQNRTEGV
jgi:hypothetical protein